VAAKKKITPCGNCKTWQKLSLKLGKQ